MLRFIIILLFLEFISIVRGTCLAGNEIKMSASDGALDDQFGKSASISGNVALIGAAEDESATGAVYFYKESALGNEDWNSNGEVKVTATLGVTGDQFGNSVSLSGSDAIIGAPYYDDGVNTDAGAVYFLHDTGTFDWSSNQIRVIASDADNWDNFGIAVEINDGSAIVGSWAGDGTVADTGAIYFYRESSSGASDWSVNEVKVFTANGVAYDRFGSGVSIDGTNAASSAYDGTIDGAQWGFAVLYKESYHGAGDWNDHAVKFTASIAARVKGAQPYYFGSDISISGSRAAVGCRGDADVGELAGAVFFYHESADGAQDWTANEVKVIPSNIAAWDEFGWAVSIDGSSAIVSAHYDWAGAYHAGSAYLFRERIPGSGDWISDEFHFTAGDGAENDIIGFSVDIDGSNAVIGALAGDGNVADTGAVYFISFECNDCLSSPCLHDGVCTDELASFQCDCTGTGYEGTTCEMDVDDCASSPCANDGVCLDAGVDMFTCNCTGLGYSGDMCQTEINECNSSPCMNDATCVDNLLHYQCTCLEGFQGTECETEINECSSSPCLHEGTCVDEIADYTCLCVDGFEGNECQTQRNDCTSSPCLNEGTCMAILNGFNCSCADGYQGIHCETDVNDCASRPCMNGGECIDMGPNAFRCDCTDTSYTDTICSVSTDPCAMTACVNGATCVAHYDTNNYTCLCAPGYEGEFCQNDIDECMSSPCVNGGTCYDLVESSYFCECTSEYTGDSCDEVIPCVNVLCENGGTCQTQDNTCECTNEYTGTSCETLISIVPTGELIIFQLSFDEFQNEDDTAESFLLELPVMLSEATNSSPQDFTVSLVDNGEVTIVYEIIYVNPDDSDEDIFIEQIESNEEINERTGDVTISRSTWVEPTEEEVEQTEPAAQDNTVLFVILIFVGLLVGVAVGFGYAKTKYDHRQKNIIGSYKADQLSVPL